MSSSYRIPCYRMDGTLGTPEELAGDLLQQAASGNVSALLHQVAVAMMANARKPLAHTKKRGEVRGGGKKPWKQKGTGRARHGSIRSPLWRGGGIVFGPRSDRNFTQTINAKMKQKAFLVLLKERCDANAVAILDSGGDVPAKTKGMAATLNNIRKSLSAPRQSLLLVCSKGADTTIRRVSRNIARTTVQDIAGLSVMDLMAHMYLLFTSAAFAVLKGRIQR